MSNKCHSPALAFQPWQASPPPVNRMSKYAIRPKIGRSGNVVGRLWKVTGIKTVKRGAKP